MSLIWIDMKRTLHVLTHLAAGVLLLAGNSCSVDDMGEFNDLTYGGDGGETQPLPELTSYEERMVKDYNLFAMRLLYQMNEQSTDLNHQSLRNITISPLSLQLALGMMENGMSDAVLHALSVNLYSGVGSWNVNQLCTKLYNRFSCRSDGTNATLGTSLWVQSGFEINPYFLDEAKQYFNARVSYVDFVNDTVQTKSYIQNWADMETEGMTKDFRIPMDKNCRMMLLNTATWHADWATPMKRLQDNGFFVPFFGPATHVPIMETLASVAYHMDEKYNTAYIPLAEGTFMMTLHVPTGWNVHEFLHDVAFGNVNIAPDEETVRRMVRLPNFVIGSCEDLKAPLYQLGESDPAQYDGLKRMFDDADAFNGINENIGLDNFTEYGYITVNERGVYAGAAAEPKTVEQAEITSSYTPFNIMGPFVYTISETETGVILFAGLVTHLGEPIADD